jgi:hypothetical protein
MAGSMVFGVVDGDRVQWLEKPVPVSEDILALTGAVPATQVLRIAATCQEKGCCHFDGTDCNLATNLVQLMPAVTDPLPPCRIRHECRWFTQEGRAACAVCPQIVTYSVNPSEELKLAATP